MRYEWNESKRVVNLRKHGVDFGDCHVVFETDGALTIEDARDYDERRYITIGWLREHLVVIAHTVRDDTIRIISARKASTHEYRLYFQQIGRH